MNMYFETIDDCPLYNWRMITSGKYEYCRKDVSNGSDKGDLEAYTKIYDSYIERFGLGSSYSMYLDKIKKLTVAICDYIITEDRFLMNSIRRIQTEINDLNKEEKGDAILSTLVALSKWMGYSLNERDIMTVFFYQIAKEYGEANK